MVFTGGPDCMRGLSVRASGSDSTGPRQKEEGGWDRESERDTQRQRGRERESLHADILPAGLVIDEPQSPWEPEMARLMNGAFLLPP